MPDLFLDGAEDHACLLHLPDVVPDGAKALLRLGQSRKKQAGQFHIFYLVRLHGPSHPGREGIGADICDGKNLFTALPLGSLAGRHLALLFQLGKGGLYAARAMGTDQSKILLDELLQLIPRHGGQEQQP